jgi:hypothetical protein
VADADKEFWALGRGSSRGRRAVWWRLGTKRGNDPFTKEINRTTPSSVTLFLCSIEWQAPFCFSPARQTRSFFHCAVSDPAHFRDNSTIHNLRRNQFSWQPTPLSHIFHLLTRLQVGTKLGQAKCRGLPAVDTSSTLQINLPFPNLKCRPLHHFSPHLVTANLSRPLRLF